MNQSVTWDEGTVGDERSFAVVHDGFRIDIRGRDGGGYHWTVYSQGGAAAKRFYSSNGTCETEELAKNVALAVLATAIYARNL